MNICERSKIFQYAERLDKISIDLLSNKAVRFKRFYCDQILETFQSRLNSSVDTQLGLR